MVSGDNRKRRLGAKSRLKKKGTDMVTRKKTAPKRKAPTKKKAAAPEPENETAAQKFTRIAELRVNKAIHAAYVSSKSSHWS